MTEEIYKTLQTFPGEVGLWLENLSTGEVFAHQAERVFMAASTIKLPMLCFALAGGANLGQPLAIKPETVALGSGVLKELSPGLALRLRDLLTLMIIVSDNTATNVVLDFFGHKQAFNQYFKARGWDQTYIAGLLALPEERPDPKREKGDAGKVSASNLGQLWRSLWRGQLLSAESTRVALDILSKQQVVNFLRYLPADLDDLEEGTTPLKLYSKSGELRCCRHDTGVLARGDRAISITVLTETDTDPCFYPDHPGTVLIGKIAEVAYRHWLA